MLEQQLRQRVILGELLQHFFVGGRRAARRLLHDRQLQLLEEDLADLLRRAEIEFAAGQLVRLPFELDEPRRDLVALRVQQRVVDQHAGALHLAQHQRHRHLDLAIHALEARFACDLRIEHVMQLQRDVGVFGRVRGGLVERHLVEADLLRALAATSSYLIVLTPRWRSARLSMSCVRCDSSTYDSSSVSCSMPFSAMP
jgi:hypothetical protein